MEKFDLVSYSSLLILSLRLCLEGLVAARRYRGRFVRPGLRLLLIVWAVLMIAWLAGIRVEVEIGVPFALLHLPLAALLVAMFYFSAEAVYRVNWGPPEPEQPEPANGRGCRKEALK